MLKKIKYCLLLLIIYHCFICGFISLSLAEELVEVKEVNITALDSKYRVFITSSSPTDYTVREYFSPRRLVVDIPHAALAFKNKKFMTIPVDRGGIKNIEVREVYTLGKIPQHVEVIILFYEDFTHEVFSQWNGKFISVDIKSTGSLPAEQEAYTLDKDRAMTEALKQAREKLYTERTKKNIEDLRHKKPDEQEKKKIEALRKRLAETGTFEKEIEDAKERLRTGLEEEKTTETKTGLLNKIQAKDIHVVSMEKRPPVQVASIKKISSLNDCIDIAQLNHRPAQISKEQLELARLRIKEAKRAFYPALLGEWKETAGRTISEEYKGRTYGVQLQQPIYMGGKLKAMLRKEELGEYIALGNYDRIKQDLIFKVITAYFELLKAQNTYNELKELTDEAKYYLEFTEKQFRIEVSTITELLHVQSSYNQIQYQLISVEKDLELAKLNLQKEMNVTDLNFSGLDYSLQFKKIDLTLDHCIELAFRNRPEPKTMRYMVSSAEYAKKVIESERRPNFSLLSSFGKAGESFKSEGLDLGTQWSIMGKVNWFFGGSTIESSLGHDESNPTAITTYTGNRTESTIFSAKLAFWDNLAHFSKSKESEITKQQAEHELEQMLQSIKSDVEEAFYNYQKAKIQATAAANEIGYRSKELEIIKNKKELQEATYAELLEALVKLAEAKASYYQALATSEIAVSGLNRAIGVIGYFK
ncbi:MAG: TolC family protein [Candidatus Omnitrophota bacterium]